MSTDSSSGLIAVTVDICRIRPREQVPEIALVRLLEVGRKTDLLETIRRTEEKDELTIELIILQASAIGLDPALARQLARRHFVDDHMIELDGDKVTLLYDSTKEVYLYAKNLLSDLTDAESNLLSLIYSSSRKAVGIEDFDKALELFKKPYRDGLRKFLLKNKLLESFEYNGAEYIISPRAFKVGKNFKTAVEVLADERLSPLIDFIRENPGNPDAVVQSFKKVNDHDLSLLSSSGIVDPLALDVNGDVKNYLFSADILRKRSDNDNSDLVKTTLANFRFGEYYSEGANLLDLKKFFQSLLDRGYAGGATPIGTDYHELERLQVLRVEPIGGTGKYRFWLLKRDVIEDCLSVVNGYVPITAHSAKAGLDSIDTVVQSRSNLNIVTEKKSAVVEAIRKIREGIGVS